MTEKKCNVSRKQDELIGALIGLAKSCQNNPYDKDIIEIVLEALSATSVKANDNEETLQDLITKVHEQKYKIVPNCRNCTSRCGNTDDYDMKLLQEAEEDIRSLKSLILFVIREMAACTYQARIHGHQDDRVDLFYLKALAVLSFDMDKEQLYSVILEAGKVLVPDHE